MSELEKLSRKEKIKYRRELEEEVKKSNAKKGSITNFLIFFTVAGLLIGASYLWFSAKPAVVEDTSNLQSLGSLKLGDEAPDFSLPATNGDTISLGDYSGKNVLLYFQEGVMCAPCWKQMTTIQERLTDFEKIGTKVISISVDSASTWEPVLNAEGISKIPVLIDEDRKVSTEYGVLTTSSRMHADRPGHTFVLIDKEGKVRWLADYPTMRVAEDEILAAISKALGP